MLLSFNFANPQTSLQIAHWASFLSIMAKTQDRTTFNKKSLLKFNVKLKTKLSQSQRLFKAKADPKPKLIQIQT